MLQSLPGVDGSIEMSVAGPASEEPSSWSETGRVRPSSPPWPPLVGRQRELDVLLGAAVHPPAVVRIEGAAGMGKTRLIQELLAHPHMAELRALVGRCPRRQDPFPLSPVVDALAALGGQPLGVSLSPVAADLRPLLPELAPQLPADGARSHPLLSQHRLFRALREVLAALGPTLLVLEDLQWADETTMGLLEFLVTDLPAQLSLVVTGRGGAQGASPLSRLLPRDGHSHVAAVTLAPLDREEVGHLAQTVLDGDVSAELAHALAQASKGVPLAVVELARVLSQRRDPPPGGWSGEEVATLGVPPLVRDATLDLVAQLSAEAKTVVRAAAVAGAVDETLLIRVSGLAGSRARRALGEAVVAGALHETDDARYRFANPLSRQAVLDATPGPERRHLHLSAARALGAERPPALVEIARHFKHAGRTKQWLHHAEAAADAAVQSAPRSGVELLLECLSDRAISAAARLRLARKLAARARSAGLAAAAIPVLREVLDDDTVTAGVRGEMRLGLVELLYLAHDSRSVKQELSRALVELRRRPALAAQAMVDLAWFSTMEGHDVEDLVWLERAVEAAARIDDPAVITAVACQRAALLLYLGDPRGWAAAEDILRPPATSECAAQLLAGYRQLSVAACLLGHYRRAEVFLHHGERIRADLNLPAPDLWLERSTLLVDYATARPGVETRAQQFLSATAEIPVLHACAQVVVGSLLLRRGDLEEAECHLQAVIGNAVAAGSVPPLAVGAAQLARLHMWADRTEEACHLGMFAIDAVRGRRAWAWAADIAPVTVDALLAAGDSHQAHDLVRRFAEGLRGVDAPAAAAALGACRGALAEAEGDDRGAERWFGRAEAAWRTLPRPYDAAQAADRRARCRWRSGKDTADIQGFIEVLEAFHSLDASWDVARVRRDLSALGVSLPYPWRGGRRSYGEGLSPREDEVARLAAQGRTNREIAEVLFVSPRTVEGHVISAMKKLGVSSRVELGAALKANNGGENGSSNGTSARKAES